MRFYLILFLVINCLIARGQFNIDSSLTMNRKNVVRINLTPNMLFGLKNYVVGYERIFRGHNSFSINLGYISLPDVRDTILPQIGIQQTRSNAGFSIAVDYRRYLKSRNRGLAPDGLYFGPYFASYNIWSERQLSFEPELQLGTTSATMTNEFHVHHLGLQIGYQFIIKKRIALDLILAGPGVGFYSAKLNLNAELDPQVEDEVFKEYIDAVLEIYPGLRNAIGKPSIERNGSFNITSAGYRMVIEVGFLF